MDEVITDASTSVRTVLSMYCDWCVCIVQLYACFLQLFYLATRFPEVHHSVDVWNKSKKLKQALAKVNVILAIFLLQHIKAAGISGLEKLYTWSGTTVNQFWHSCILYTSNATVLKVN